MISSYKTGRFWLHWFGPCLSPELSILKDVFFTSVQKALKPFDFNHVIFPFTQWKIYFFKAWNEFFPPAKLSVPWNEFLTANLILPSNTSSEQHRPDSISHQSGWSITSVDHKNHVTQVMHSLYCHQACGNPTSDFILARFIRWDIIYSVNPVQFWKRVSISTVPGERGSYGLSEL